MPDDSGRCCGFTVDWKMWSPLAALLELHKSYYGVFRETIDIMFYGDGPLPVDYRHYIALMAACRHRCEYLMELHKAEFLRAGGDENWLEGVQKVPQKLRNLDHLNRILAHQPWLLQTLHFQKLTQTSSPVNWSLGELVQAALILSHIHALCSFVHAEGIRFDGGEAKRLSSRSGSADQSPTSKRMSKNGFSSTETANGSSTSHDRTDNVETLMATMEKLSQSCSQSSQEDKQQQFFDINMQNSEITAVEDPSPTAASLEECSRYTQEMDFCYSDFAKRDEAAAAPTFKIHDCSWDDQGYSVISQFCSELTNVIDQKFHLTRNLTYYTMGDHSGVDTTKYRMAVWNYIQSLYGIRHDDYDYAEVNKLISRPMKTFVKTACCFPERMTEKLRSNVMVDFQHSEKVHVNIMILEARFQAALLYLLRAIMRFMT